MEASKRDTVSFLELVFFFFIIFGEKGYSTKN